MHSSRSVSCTISSYVLIFVVALGTLSRMTLAAPGRASSSHTRKSTGKFDLDKVATRALSALIKAAFHIWQRMPQSAKSKSKKSKQSKKSHRSIDNDSFFDDFD